MPANALQGICEGGFALTAAMDAGERARAAARGVGQSDLSLMWLAVGFVAVLVLLGIVSALIHLIRYRRQYQLNWNRFADEISRRGLDQRQGELLVELAKAGSVFNPSAVMEKLDVFEKAVDRYLRRFLGAGPGSAELQGACERVRDLRSTLNFWSPPGSTYYGTRELDAGQDLRFGPAGGRAAASVWAKTGPRREDFLELVEVERMPDALAGRAVEVIFFSRRSAYSFRADVVQVNNVDASCLLSHTVDLKPAGKREFHRVEVGRPLTFRAAWEEDGVKRAGTLVDLSAGGLCLSCPCYYETGEKIVVHIQPQDYYAKSRADAELPRRQIEVTVIRTRRADKNLCIYHMEFRGITGEDRGYLSQVVYRIDVGARGAAW